MSRFTLAEGATQKDIGRAVLKAAADAYRLRKDNKGRSLTDEEAARLAKKHEPVFEKLFPSRNIKVVFDEKDLGYVIIPYFDPKAKDGDHPNDPFDLTGVAEECLGGIVFSGCV